MVHECHINYLVVGNSKLKHSLRKQMLRSTEWTGLSLPTLQKPNPKPELRQRLHPPPCWQGADLARRSDNNSLQDYLKWFPARFPSSFVFGAKHPYSPRARLRWSFAMPTLAWRSVGVQRCLPSINRDSYWGLRSISLKSLLKDLRGCGKHRYCSHLPSPEEGRHPPKVSAPGKTAPGELKEPLLSLGWPERHQGIYPSQPVQLSCVSSCRHTFSQTAAYSPLSISPPGFTDPPTHKTIAVTAGQMTPRMLLLHYLQTTQVPSCPFNGAACLRRD